MSIKRYRRIIALASITVIAGASVAVSAFASSAPGAAIGAQSGGPGQAQPAGGVAAPDSQQLGAFAALGAPASAVDQRMAQDPDALKTLQGSQASAQANPSLARNVYEGETGSVFLVPGSGTLCLLVNGHAFGWTATCASNPQALAGGLGFVYYSTSPSGQLSDFTIAGVLPDGARDMRIVDAAGNATPVTLSQRNGYWASAAGASSMIWRSADGTQHTIALPRAPRSSGG